MTAMGQAVADGATVSRVRRTRKSRRIALYAFLTVMAVTWLFPLLWAVYTALRPYADTLKNGYISLPTTLSFDNFVGAWNKGEFPMFYLNSLIIAVPAVIVTLFVASMVAFAVTRFNWRFNLVALMIFTAGNLLPAQVIIIPLYWLYQFIPFPPSDNGKLLYDQFLGVILINIVFQTGFCVFVLSNYMKTLPTDIDEAALVDGASLWLRYWRIVLPLCRPAMAALATLLTTWIYNDFFWAITLISTGNKRPITSALANLQGQFVTNQNMIAAAALMAAIPTLIVYILLQKQFIAGLSLGSSKG
jgi:multiple sugar transport system permease protein